MSTTTKILIGIVAILICAAPAMAEIDAIIDIPNYDVPDIYLRPQVETVIELTDYEKLESFLTEDNVSNHEYIHGGKNTYICTHFATDLAKSLNEFGYESGIVTKSAKYHGDQGHMMTWVIIENDTYIIESQNDYIMGSDEFNGTIDFDKFMIDYESIESGERKCNEMYQKLM